VGDYVVSIERACMHARVRVRIHACTCQLVKTASVSIESELSTAQLADSTPRARSSSSRADGLTLYAADESALPIVVLECKTSERARRKGGVEERMMGTGYRYRHRYRCRYRYRS
tara:strand:+ start:52 stop:396 length:345 start_codon:yes stop_codon:yes gene_type:complete